MSGATLTTKSAAAWSRPRRSGFEPVPLLMAWATPAGPVTDAAFDDVTGRLVDALCEQRPDGLLLALHGAMVAESHPDADGEVLARLRRALGPDFPIVVTLDLHGNLSERLVTLSRLPSPIAPTRTSISASAADGRRRCWCGTCAARCA